MAGLTPYASRAPYGSYGHGKTYASYEHYKLGRTTKAADRAAFGSGVVHIDASQIAKLERALIAAGTGYDKSKAILAQSLNRAGMRVNTHIKRSLQVWTGIRRQKAITERMTPVIASPGKMSAGVIVTGRHFRVTTSDFGAAWRRSWPGGRHAAWSRPQTAKGSFMAMKGRGDAYGGGLLFKRTSRQRFPIKPLWGPHPVKELKKRTPYVRAIVTKEANWFLRESARRAEVELRKAKAKYGL